MPVNSEKSSVVDDACERIKAMIRDGQLESGQCLSERKATEMLGISRTSAHDAILRLEDEGYFSKTGPRGSWQVANMFDEDSPHEFIERIEIRKALLGEAACLAARNMSHQQAMAIRAIDHAGTLFHYIVAHCGNRYIQKMWKQYGLTQIWIQDASVREEMRQLGHTTVEEAAAIWSEWIDALVNRRPDMAKQLADSYHEICLERIRGYVAEHAADTLLRTRRGSSKLSRDTLSNRPALREKLVSIVSHWD